MRVRVSAVTVGAGVVPCLPAIHQTGKAMFRYITTPVHAALVYGFHRLTRRYRVLSVPINSMAPDGDPDKGYIVVDRKTRRFAICWEVPILEYIAWRYDMMDTERQVRIGRQEDRRHWVNMLNNLRHGPTCFWETEGDTGFLMRALWESEKAVVSGEHYQNELAGHYVYALSLSTNQRVAVGCSYVQIKEFPRIRSFLLRVAP